MAFTYAKYEKKYLKSCAEIIRSTWTFDKDFINPKNPDYVYEYYILDCVNWSEHLDLLVDEKGQAMGILFGSIENTTLGKRIKFSFNQVVLCARFWFHILNGDFGDRKRAAAVYRDMKNINADGESEAKSFDSEVNLFILSPAVRGQGYGKKLMDRYIEFCQINQLKKAFLWTTTGCTWQFYERYGFKLHERFTHKDITAKEAPKAPNGMVYCMDIQ